MRLASLLCVLILLVGCVQQETLQKFVSPENQAMTKHYIDLLRTHDYDAIEKDMDPTLASPSVHETLVGMAAMIPAGEPSSVELVGVQQFFNRSTGIFNRSAGREFTSVNTTFEYRFGDQWRLINVVIKTENGASTIIGFHVYTESESMKTRNRFSLKGKSFGQYVVMAAAIVAALVTLIGLIVCIRTPIERRKWLWILFILIGIGKIGVNWTTGRLYFMPLFIQLFSASAFAQLYGPWIISFSLPIGAILFLVRRKKLMRVE